MKKFKNKTTIFLILAIIILCLLYSIIYFFYMPKITLNKKSTMTINYKEPFIDPGVKTNSKNKVKIIGNVNSKKLGIYKIQYTLKKGIFTKKVVRIVKVRDIEKPSINLSNNDKEVYVCPNKEYEQEEFTVKDNYDKDLKNKVKVKITDSLATYVVADSSGNYDIKKKKIYHKDIENPVIKLNSSDTIFTFLNEEFIDPGFSATDNCDKDITSNVKITGSVDTSTTGTYIITYEVEDKSGNKEKAERKVNVIKKGQPGTIYLTFDDGPREGTTDKILDILKEEGVKATFFVTNKGPDDLIVREYNEGHTVGLHTASHNYSLIYSSVDNYFNDLTEVHDRVLNLTGYDSKIIRFPGGSSNTISRKYKIGIMKCLTTEVIKRGYKYYDWNILSGDAGETTISSEVYKKVTSRLSHDKVNIVLMHDIKSYTRDALRDIIKYGKDNGYSFEAITNDTEMLTQRVNN